MKVVVLTGGIGSGKSLACNYFAKTFGWPVYNADLKVKELYATHPSLLQSIEAVLNLKLRGDDGNFVPRLLADRIFSDRSALETVEALVFPVLMEDFERWKLSLCDKDVVLLESATIMEKPQLAHIGDLRLVIDAPLDVRLLRASERDGVSQDLIRRRIDSQKLMNEISDAMFDGSGVEIIVNDGGVESFYDKLSVFAEKLL